MLFIRNSLQFLEVGPAGATEGDWILPFGPEGPEGRVVGRQADGDTLVVRFETAGGTAGVLRLTADDRVFVAV